MGRLIDMGEQSNTLGASADDAAQSSMEGLISRRDEFLRFVERRVSDRAVAEDILQAAYARAVAHVDSLRNKEIAEAWFYRVLRNAVIDYYRHRSVVDRFVEPIDEAVEPAAPARDEMNLCPCLGDAVDALRPTYAEVLREVDLAEETTGALVGYAKRSGITVATAAVRSHRARKALEKKLRHTCGSCAGAGCLDCNCKPAGRHQG